MKMENGEGVERRPPRYEGEDVSELTTRELRGWYAYGSAAEVYAVCGVGVLNLANLKSG